MLKAFGRTPLDRGSRDGKRYNRNSATRWIHYASRMDMTLPASIENAGGISNPLLYSRGSAY